MSGGPELPKKVCADLNKSFELRDQLVHPKPGGCADLLGNHGAADAVLGFLIADLLLAKVWADKWGRVRVPPRWRDGALTGAIAKVANGQEGRDPDARV